MTSPTVYATEVRRVRDAGLETSDIATATGSDPTTVVAWMASRRSPSGERRIRLIDLSAIVERLQEVMDPGYVPIWLNKPVRALDDQRPIDLIGRGDSREVLRLVAQLENDNFS
jgi:hypothetical protein